MLTPEQVAIRATGIGASEVSSILELNPYAGPIDVWLRKPTPSRGPLVVGEDTDATDVGTFFEDGARALYTHRTGRKVTAPRKTLRHKKAPRVLASPDGLIVGERRGLEIKIVGANMLHHWEGDTVPDYVMLQCAQNMAVLNRDMWDVIAFLGGTTTRIFTIDRDLELEASIIEGVEEYWETYIEGDTPPPTQDLEERKRYLRARYPGSEKQACRAAEDETTRTAVETYLNARAVLALAEKDATRATQELLEMVGDDYGIEGAWGKFIAPACRGKVDWHAVAEQLAGGSVPVELAESFRGEPYRQARHYPSKRSA